MWTAFWNSEGVVLGSLEKDAPVTQSIILKPQKIPKNASQGRGQ